MFPMVRGCSASSAAGVVAAPAHEPACILVALVDGLAGGGHQGIEVRDGEIFLTTMASGPQLPVPGQ